MSSKQPYTLRGSFDPNAIRADGTRGKYIEVEAAPSEIGYRPEAPDIEPDDGEIDFYFTLEV